MIAAYKKMHPKDVTDTGVASGFDAVNIMAQAINRAGKVDATAIRDALAKTDYKGLLGRVRFDKNGHSQPRCSITQVRGGVQKIVYQLN